MSEKVELRRSEPLCAGLCILIPMVMISFAASIRTIDLEELGTIDTESELSDLHDSLTEERDAILLAAALFWCTFPFFVLHLFFIIRVFRTILSFYDTNMKFPFSFGFDKVYTATQIVILLIYACIEPCLMVLTVYYNWEFTDSSGATSYTGYYIQFCLARATTVLHDSSAIPLLIFANMPWIWFICVDLIGRPSNTEGKEKRKQVSNRIMCCHGLFGNVCCSLIMILFVLCVVILTLMTMFSWNSSGFWSYSGDSQSFGDIVIISYLFLGIWLIYISCKLDTIKTHFYIADTSDDYTAIDQEPQDNI